MNSCEFTVEMNRASIKDLNIQTRLHRQSTVSIVYRSSGLSPPVYYIVCNMEQQRHHASCIKNVITSKITENTENTKRVNALQFTKVVDIAVWEICFNVRTANEIECH